MADSLAVLIQALPAELYDEIYNLTFAASATETRTIDEHYDFPACLHVSHSTREQFAESYYGEGAIFFVHEKIAKTWLKCLPPAHARHVREIRYVENGGPRYWTPLNLAELARTGAKLIELLEDVCAISVDVEPGTVKLLLEDPDGVRRWVGWYDFSDTTASSLRSFLSN